MKEFIKNLKDFYKYFKKNNIKGGRFAYSYLRWHIKDDEERKQFFDRFCVSCPPMLFLGEREVKNEYYMYTNKWNAVRHILTTIEVCKTRWWATPRYLWWLIGDLWHLNDDYNYYMNPTPIRKR